MKRFQAAPATEQRFGLGEGPLWDGDRNRVLWVDINAGAIHSGTLSAAGVIPLAVFHLPGTVGAVACSAQGELLVAGARHLYEVSPDGEIRLGPQLIDEQTASRLNDGGCDAAGRFLVGTLALDDRANQEVLVRIEKNGTITTLDHDLGLSNGIAFAPGGALLYSVDTISGTVWVRDYDPGTGAVGARNALLKIADAHPDGLCVDEQGNLWIAMFGAGEVRCYSSAGAPLAVVDVDAPNTTCAAFVGPSLDTLLITTASEQLTDAQRASYPDSGRLFIANVGVRGLPVPMWAGSAAAPSAEQA
jgi:sugar lactone lactonase YvrE